MIDVAPEVNHLALQLHLHLIQVPFPTANPTHTTDALPPNVTSEHWPKSVPAHPHGFMTKVDTALE